MIYVCVHTVLGYAKSFETDENDTSRVKAILKNQDQNSRERSVDLIEAHFPFDALNNQQKVALSCGTELPGTLDYKSSL